MNNANDSDRGETTKSMTRREMIVGGTTLAALAAANLAGADAAAAQQPAAKTEPPPQNSAGKLAGRVALITGGAHGQGRAHALALAREGADIVVCDINRQISTVPYAMGTKDELKETERLVKETGRRCLAVEADIREMAQMKSLADQTIKEFGKIDILLANAGIFGQASLAKMSDQQLRDMIDVDLIGTINSFRAVIPHMTERKLGRIVATSSTVGRQGVANMAHYCAAKWGVVGLVKAAALELGAFGITVNVVLPTSVNTVMFRHEANYRAFRPDLPNPTEADIKPMILAAHAIQVPWVEPEDVSNAILYFVSDAARYVTGVSIDVAAGGNARYTA